MKMPRVLGILKGNKVLLINQMNLLFLLELIEFVE